MASCEDCCGPGGCGPGAKPSRVIDFGVPAFDRRGTVHARRTAQGQHVVHYAGGEGPATLFVSLLSGARASNTGLF